jgi:hypothetical protein
MILVDSGSSEGLVGGTYTSPSTGARFTNGSGARELPTDGVLI